MNIRAFLVFALLLFVFPAVNAQATRKISVTFDDLPGTHNVSDLKELTAVNAILLSKLKARDLPAAVFVNERKLYVPGEIDERTAILEKWLDAGHTLGNHTFSHIAINSNSFEAYRDDLIRGETVTRMLLENRGKKLRYFRHTQLRTGPTDDYRKQLSEFLKRRGYTVAPVTIDNNEYIFATVYENALAENNGKLADRIAVAYVEYMNSVFSHFEDVSREFLNREPAQVLLLHVNRINADHFEKLASMMEKRGYQFVSLDEALKDEAYSLPEVTSRRGLSWIHRWMLAKGLEMKEEPNVQDWIAELYARRD
ncbi:MAG: polysaccharide deacetylase [Acidobacteria bacterium]|nr:MAG: polysaccharide deacetylase [Acidobacteriota bacterium]REK02589.1 MAG: polysaccharide deacetylase [Acidobacteriota bacterium]REK13608.1 MAG: polysaccharide deacetylase [Acidobacteriota bacterium]REK41602.1 MAG: polysaccharide deacetylase [Acidobacteriota bacterium]